MRHFACFVTVGYRIEVGRLYLRFPGRPFWMQGEKNENNTHSFNRNCLSSSYMPGTLLSSWDTKDCILPWWSICVCKSSDLTPLLPPCLSPGTSPSSFSSSQLFHYSFSFKKKEEEKRKKTASITGHSRSPDVVQFSWWTSCGIWGLGLAGSTLNLSFYILEKKREVIASKLETKRQNNTIPGRWASQKELGKE